MGRKGLGNGGTAASAGRIVPNPTCVRESLILPHDKAAEAGPCRRYLPEPVVPRHVYTPAVTATSHAPAAAASALSAAVSFRVRARYPPEVPDWQSGTHVLQPIGRTGLCTRYLP